ncbi:prophage CP4-57 regulatory protein AlpA [Legionella donaldsonii]|uniref:Prophage CP4-57 regulatory protein AlpA n=1 Tax=Legionella donaldsonii TaxID=45060 RepID=A0A378JA60_9GAMM|nr:AlpA family transcriptional regulator [Legionella donaldsonii]STX44495.1 prophage CP4-57 regulatory protein AlpA [Legionella donaldsonii]
MPVRVNEKETSNQKLPLKILRRRAVQERTGLGRSSIYSKISQGEFPKPIALGDRSVGWIEEEITSWIEQRIQSSRMHGGGK